MRPTAPHRRRDVLAPAQAAASNRPTVSGTAMVSDITEPSLAINTGETATRPAAIEADTGPSADPAGEESGQQCGQPAAQGAGQLETGSGGDAQFEQPGEEERIAGHEVGGGLVEAGEDEGGIGVAVTTGQSGGEQDVPGGVEAQFQVLPDRQCVGDAGADRDHDHEAEHRPEGDRPGGVFRPGASYRSSCDPRLPDGQVMRPVDLHDLASPIAGGRSTSVLPGVPPPGAHPR